MQARFGSDVLSSVSVPWNCAIGLVQQECLDVWGRAGQTLRNPRGYSWSRVLPRLRRC
jgi:hypothetical protein